MILFIILIISRYSSAIFSPGLLLFSGSNVVSPFMLIVGLIDFSDYRLFRPLIIRGSRLVFVFPPLHFVFLAGDQVEMALQVVVLWWRMS